jgi:hypothetical protein
MKHRPQVQFRFRDVEQMELTKKLAEESGVSGNEFILQALDERLVKGSFFKTQYLDSTRRGDADLKEQVVSEPVVGEVPTVIAEKRAKKAARKEVLKKDVKAAMPGLPEKAVARLGMKPSDAIRAMREEQFGK